MSPSSVLRLLDLEAEGVGSWSGPAANDRHVRAFGGQLLAQGLRAAGHTVNDPRQAHSMHAYFLRPARPDRAVRYDVVTLRDGRSFSLRRVDGWQSGSLIFTVTISFHDPERGIEHQSEAPKVPAPDDLVPFESRFAGRAGNDDMARWFERASSFDIRYVSTTPFDVEELPRRAAQQVWVKTKDRLPEDQHLHRSVLAYVSDLTILDAVLLAHGMRWTDRAVMGATLDHAIWFHRDVVMDDWLLLDESSPVAASARGLAVAQVWNRAGQLVATVNQEALLRPPAAFQTPS